MTDREKAIKGFETCFFAGDECETCPYWESDCLPGLKDNQQYGLQMKKDVLELLKEQEPVEPSWRQGKAYCGACGKRIPLKIGARFCHKCGRGVNWKNE